MKFKPDFKYEIIEEKDFTKKINTISNELEKYETTVYVNAKNNCTLCCKYYLAENAKKSLIILHGFTEFMKKYEELIWYFLHMGYNVFCFDQRGHGLSGREVDDITLAHINSFEDYVSDLEQVIDEVVVPNSGNTPLCIFSHSMGGGVAMLYMQKHNDKISQAVLSSPLVSPQTSNIPEPIVKAYIKKHSKGDSWSSRFIQSNNNGVNQKILSDKRMSIGRFRRTLNFHLNFDSYKSQNPTNRWVYESLGLRRKILDSKKLKNIKTNILIISAENDSVVQIKPQIKLSKMLPKCEFITIKNAKHTIFTCSNAILNDYYKVLFDFLEN